MARVRDLTIQILTDWGWDVIPSAYGSFRGYVCILETEVPDDIFAHDDLDYVTIKVEVPATPRSPFASDFLHALHETMKNVYIDNDLWVCFRGVNRRDPTPKTLQKVFVLANLARQYGLLTRYFQGNCLI